MLQLFSHALKRGYKFITTRRNTATRPSLERRITPSTIRPPCRISPLSTLHTSNDDPGNHKLW